MDILSVHCDERKVIQKTKDTFTQIEKSIINNIFEQ